MDEKWKIYLIELYYLNKRLRNLITLNILIDQFGRTKGTYRKQSKKLLKMGYVNVIQQKGLENRWELTLDGINVVKSLRKKHSLLCQNIKKKLL